MSPPPPLSPPAPPPAPRAPFRPGIYAILDLPTLADRPPLPVAEALLEGGAVALQLRAKDALPAADLLPLARSLAALCRQADVPFLVNDDLTLAARCGAHGVHLGQTDAPPEAARALLGDAALVGLSTHTLDQVRRASRTSRASRTPHAQAVSSEPGTPGEPGSPRSSDASVSYLGFGPVFATHTKAGADPVQGVAALAEACRATPLPVVAIGGITAHNVAQVASAGAHAAAAIGTLLRPADADGGTDAGGGTDAHANPRASISIPGAPRAVRQATEALTRAFTAHACCSSKP